MHVPDILDTLPGPALATRARLPGVNSREVSCSLRVAPRYPRAELAAGRSGSVEVEFTVQPDGSVTDAVVVATELPRAFRSAALHAVNRWKCEPRIVDGAPVSRRAAQKIEFTINPD